MKRWQLLQNWPEKDKKEMGDVIDLDFMFLQSFIKRGQNVRWKTQQKKKIVVNTFLYKILLLLWCSKASI